MKNTRLKIVPAFSIPDFTVARQNPAFRYQFLLPSPPAPQDHLVTFHLDHLWVQSDIINLIIDLSHPYGVVHSIHLFLWEGTRHPSRQWQVSIHISLELPSVLRHEGLDPIIVVKAGSCTVCQYCISTLGTQKSPTTS